MNALADLPADSAAAQRWLDLAAPVSSRRVDPRIDEVLARIIADPVGTQDACGFAAELGVSESRFLHLFRQESGTSLRRYRLWIRLIRAGVAVGSGKSITDAAADAGFASPSHLADRFKSTFGLTASQLIGSGVVVHIPDGDTLGDRCRDHETPA